MLLGRVRRAVHDRFAVDLELEVHLVGEFTAGVAGMEKQACL
jgi:hypothetical protein